MKATKLALCIALLTAPGAFCGTIVYDVVLDGPSEVAPNASPGTGIATVTIDDVAHTLAIDVTFSGLTGTTTASHIHCCTLVPFTAGAGVATQTPTFSGFPLGVTAGAYTNTFDMTLAATWNNAFVTANGGTPAGAEAALEAGALAGEAYLNIHSRTFGAGEIRGFLVAETPEPGTFALGGCLLLGIAGARKRFARR